MELAQIAFGGGCHWCTEAVFQTLIGIENVKQGWISSTNENNSFSEAVIVYFDAEKVELKTLIEIHLLTHKSKSNHSMRNKYRSAVYCFSKSQKEISKNIIDELQLDYKDKIITQLLEFIEFKPSKEEFQNYYQSNPEKPFCKNYINPKLKFLLKNFSSQIEKSKVSHLFPTI
jgi:peptide-methionine (S)-S-oxide reductase